MKNNKGISLIELVVAIGIMSIVMLIITEMLVNATRFFERQSSNVELQNEAQIVTNYLTEAIMEANGMEFDNVTGVYKLFTTAPGAGGTDTYATGKGEKRILYYDSANTSLYVVVFNVSDPIPDSSTFARDGYLISKQVEGFNISFAKADIMDDSTTEDPSTGATAAPEKGVINPVKVDIEFRLRHNLAAANFEITADCRNHLNEVSLTDSSGTTKYTAYDR